MIFLPIVVRELRVTARSKGFYRARFWTAVAAIAYGTYLMLVFSSTRFAGVGGAGRMVFSSVAGLGLLYCILLARNTADCVSEEKREGTLGLLFLTDLKGHDVVLGKLCSNSLKSFYGLLATAPVVCCVFAMGGVPGLEVWRTILALLNVFFFSHAAGLMASTFSREPRRAIAGTAALLLAYFIGIPALVPLLSYGKLFGAADLLGLLNPAHAYHEAAAIGTGSGAYWKSLLLVHLNAWLFLAIASLAMPRCWQDKPMKTNSRWSARVRQWCYGPLAVREALRRRLLAVNPFLWLASRNRLGQIAVWGVLGLIGWGWVLIAVLFGLDIYRPTNAWPLSVMIILLNHGVLKVWIASDACWQLSEQRRSGALEYLLSCTPLSVPEIIRGQWMALRRRFLGPMIAVLVLDAVLMPLCSSGRANSVIGKADILYFCVIAAMVMLVADALAIGWLGMWLAMAEKKPHTASGSVILRILVLPWVILFLMARGFSGDVVPVLWLLLGFGIDVGFALSARRNLLTRFRAQAAMQPDESLGILGQLGRFLGHQTHHRTP